MNFDYGYVVILSVGVFGIGFMIGAISMYKFCKSHINELTESEEDDD